MYDYVKEAMGLRISKESKLSATDWEVYINKQKNNVDNVGRSFAQGLKKYTYRTLLSTKSLSLSLMHLTLYETFFTNVAKLKWSEMWANGCSPLR